MPDLLAELPVEDSEGWTEWLVVRRTDYGVSITVDYQRPGGVRSTWQDSGVTIDNKDLAAVVNALNVARIDAGRGT